jgi:hypothetical protein
MDVHDYKHCSVLIHEYLSYNFLKMVTPIRVGVDGTHLFSSDKHFMR